MLLCSLAAAAAATAEGPPCRRFTAKTRNNFSETAVETTHHRLVRSCSSICVISRILSQTFYMDETSICSTCLNGTDSFESPQVCLAPMSSAMQYTLVRLCVWTKRYHVNDISIVSCHDAAIYGVCYTQRAIQSRCWANLHISATHCLLSCERSRQLDQCLEAQAPSCIPRPGTWLDDLRHVPGKVPRPRLPSEATTSGYSHSP